MDPSLLEYLPAVTVSVLVFGAATLTTLHAIFNKPESRSAIGWIGLVWLSPVIGVVLYLLLGINRLRRQAKTLRNDVHAYNQPDRSAIVPPERVNDHVRGECEHLVAVAMVGETTSHRPLVGGNLIEPLYDGDEAYPAMLEAIRNAERSVSLASYIFDNDDIGREFVDTLAGAVERGVEVRVLIDAAGMRYSFPSIIGRLRKRHVPVAKFLPSSLIPPYILSFNLRNHRKIMVVDGRVGFTGGINIRDACLIERSPPYPTHDLHFRLTGPIVLQLQEIFAEDWTFTTGERLEHDTWFPSVDAAGETIARGIPDGPDEDLDKLRWIILGAVSEARESIKIVTPYFLPDESLLEALIVARMRGVSVDVVMPEKNNLPPVKWAAMGQLERLLEHDVHVWFAPGHFDHSKVTVIDDAWVLIGSPNWDPRSLRLNFEFAVECYDLDLAATLCEWIDGRIAGARRWTLAEHRERSFFARLRDGVFRLLAPYL